MPCLLPSMASITCILLVLSVGCFGSPINQNEKDFIKSFPSEHDYIKDFFRNNSDIFGHIDASPPRYDAETDIKYLEKLLEHTAKNVIKRKMDYKEGISTAAAKLKEHELQHLQLYTNQYGSKLLKEQLNQEGLKFVEKGMQLLLNIFDENDGQQNKTKPTGSDSFMDDAKKYLEKILENSDITYDKFLDYVINYVEENTHFWLFTRHHKGFQEISIGNASNISLSHFDSNRPTIILIHGWINAGDNFYSKNMIQAYKAYGDYNIISVDWSKLSYMFYTLSRLSVNFVGPYVAKLVDNLIEEENVDPAMIHVLGHSLGAHVAGIAGSFVKSGKIHRITGFDPASPLFGDDDKYRLNQDDAEFVDVIHSSLLGMQDALGHVDFYPNGGGPIQPGCGINIGVCPHRRSYQYYIESMQNEKEQFLSYPCDTWMDFEDLKCTKEPIAMGIHVPLEARGKFYLKTGEEFPFALGRHSLDLVESKSNGTHKHPHKKPHNKHPQKHAS